MTDSDNGAGRNVNFIIMSFVFEVEKEYDPKNKSYRTHKF